MTSRWRQFLLTRAGIDAYSVFLLVAFFILRFAARISGIATIMIPAYLLLVYSLFRMLSSNRFKRQVENSRFLSLGQSALRWFRLKKTRMADKDHRYFRCPNCRQPLRVPRGKGKIQVTCRACGAHFEEKS